MPAVCLTSRDVDAARTRCAHRTACGLAHPCPCLCTHMLTCVYSSCRAVLRRAKGAGTVNGLASGLGGGSGTSVDMGSGAARSSRASAALASSAASCSRSSRPCGSRPAYQARGCYACGHACMFARPVVHVCTHAAHALATAMHLPHACAVSWCKRPRVPLYGLMRIVFAWRHRRA